MSSQAKAAGPPSSWRAMSAPAPRFGRSPCSSQIPSVLAVTSPAKLPRGRKVLRSRRWKTVRVSAWSVRIHYPSSAPHR